MGVLGNGSGAGQANQLSRAGDGGGESFAAEGSRGGEDLLTLALGAGEGTVRGGGGGCSKGPSSRGMGA